MTLKMNHLFGGIAGGVAFGLVSGLLLGSCVFEAGPNHRAAGGGAASMASQEMAQEPPQAAPTPGGMDPGSSVMATVFAKVGELKSAIEKDPLDRASLIELGNLYYDSGKYDQAAPLYERALAVDRKDPNVLTDAGNAYFLLGDTTRAQPLFEEAQKGFPMHWQSAASLFFLAATTKNATLAGSALERVKSLNPTFEKLPEMQKIYEDLNRGGRT
jgi:tetratricopeptide (TPR) repeat protein